MMGGACGLTLSPLAMMQYREPKLKEMLTLAWIGGVPSSISPLFVEVPLPVLGVAFGVIPCFYLGKFLPMSMVRSVYRVSLALVVGALAAWVPYLIKVV